MCMQTKHISVVLVIVNIMTHFSCFKPKRSGGGGALNAPLRILPLTHLVLELHYCALGTSPKKFGWGSKFCPKWGLKI